jgi:hypothetical protein
MKFEEAGRALDREVAKLAAFLDQKVKPATRRDTAKLLRKAALRLGKMARELEKPERRTSGKAS